MRLFPYLYGLADEASRTGMPMMRPLALRWPEWDPGWTMTDEYLLGDRIVVAPVVQEGATTRRVRLPAGTFYPLLGGAAVTLAEGGGETTVDAPLEELPAFVPAGTILVLLPDGVDTAAREGVTDAGVATLDGIGDDREAWLWSGGSSDWTEAGGTLHYQWTAAEASSATGAATWNGAPAGAVDGAIAVTGNGTLHFVGGATLQVSGRAEGSALVVRVVGG
jgi:alpha-glucosidase (family GH31 glycosyl hydrolase)